MQITNKCSIVSKLEDGLKFAELSSLKEKVIGLKEDMHKITPNLSAHDLKLHNDHIDNLLADINSKLQLKEVGVKAVGIAKQPITRIRSMSSGSGSIDGGLDSDNQGESHLSEFGEKLRNRRKQIQEDLANGANIGDIKGKVSGLREDLRKHAPDLSPYEHDLHNKHIDKLMHDVDSKLKLSDTREKVFEFGKAPISKLRSRSSSNAAASFENPIVDGQATFLNQDLVLLDPTKVYKGLQNCTISSSDYNDPPKSGSLTVQFIKDSVVSLRGLPFKNGSVFISDASNCVIILHLPNSDKVQVRLHNLYNCKISVFSEDYLVANQTVVIENCKGCIFHQTCESHITIQNFDTATKKNVQDGDASANDYKFDEFNTYLGNVQELKKHYVKAYKK